MREKGQYVTMHKDLGLLIFNPDRLRWTQVIVVDKELTLRVNFLLRPALACIGGLL